MKLFTPGPVPVPAEVMNAASQPVLHHHSDEFRRIVAQTKKDLQAIFDTQGTIAMLSGSAMTGIESVTAACIDSGDHVLVLVHGRFGERLETCCRLRQAEVHVLVAPWGETISVEQVRSTMRELSACRLRAVWLVHSETSTGVSLDLEGIARVVNEESPDTLLLVDGVTCVAIQELRTDAWKLDAVVTGAQKGLMSPPGVAIIAMSRRFEDIVRGSRSRLYANDLRSALEVNDRDMMLWTPPVTIVRAVHVAASMIVQKGLETVWREHTERCEYIRQQALARGFTVFGQGTSKALLIVMHPRINEIRRSLLERHQMVLADGQDQAAGQMMRIGTCGSYTISDLEELFRAIDDVLAHIGVGT